MARTEHIAFREEKAVVEKIDAQVKKTGLDRADWIRWAVREKLERTL